MCPFSSGTPSRPCSSEKCERFKHQKERKVIKAVTEIWLNYSDVQGENQNADGWMKKNHSICRRVVHLLRTSNSKIPQFFNHHHQTPASNPQMSWNNFRKIMRWYPFCCWRRICVDPELHIPKLFKIRSKILILTSDEGERGNSWPDLKVSKKWGHS